MEEMPPTLPGDLRWSDRIGASICPIGSKLEAGWRIVIRPRTNIRLTTHKVNLWMVGRVSNLKSRIAHTSHLIPPTSHPE